MGECSLSSMQYIAVKTMTEEYSSMTNETETDGASLSSRAMSLRHFSSPLESHNTSSESSQDSHEDSRVEAYMYKREDSGSAANEDGRVEPYVYEPEDSGS